MKQLNQAKFFVNPFYLNTNSYIFFTFFILFYLTYVNWCNCCAALLYIPNMYNLLLLLLCTAQSFDDEGVVLADNLDEQHLQSLSPKVMVRDILPGVPDKANLSVRLDDEMLALSGIKETVEEIVHVPRETLYPLVHNILIIPKKRLRKECAFKLPKEFELFKKQVSRLKNSADRCYLIVIRVLCCSDCHLSVKLRQSRLLCRELWQTHLQLILCVR